MKVSRYLGIVRHTRLTELLPNDFDLKLLESGVTMLDCSKAWTFTWDGAILQVDTGA